MTPALSAVYDQLMGRAMAPPFRARALALRETFLRRTSSRTPAGPAEPEDRVRASWDDALTTGGLCSLLSRQFEDPAERALVRVLARAHRSVFRISLVGRHLIVADVLDGGSFLLLPRDDIGRELVALGGEDAPLLEARIVAATDGSAILPGVLFHPPDATSLIGEICAVARKRGMSSNEICDALLRMQHSFRNLSRVKIGYAYKIDALTAPVKPSDLGARD